MAPSAGSLDEEARGDLVDSLAGVLTSAAPEELAEFVRAWAAEHGHRRDEAISLYLRAAGPLRPLSLTRAWTMGASGLTADDRRTIGSDAAAARAPALEEADFCFVLGAVLDRRGMYDDAFAAFAAGNALTAERLDLARAEANDVARHDAMQRALGPEFIAQRQGRGHPSTAPIFVVGMPRSGTTLIEQILATHPGVQGLGEPDALSQVLLRQFPVAPLAPEPADHYRRLGAQYLQRVRALGWDGRRRFVDKFPVNYLAVGLISLIFPRATILHSVRDPMDTCFSNFSHRFYYANELTYDLAFVGRGYVRYRRLMDHWSAAVPGKVIDVRNETLVADPEAGIRWLVTQACRLPWTERCLAFHENPRKVTTLSRHQVRRPMFTSSIGRWRRYERHLGPLIEALGPYGSGLGA